MFSKFYSPNYFLKKINLELFNNFKPFRRYVKNFVIGRNSSSWVQDPRSCPFEQANTAISVVIKIFIFIVCISHTIIYHLFWSNCLL